MRRSLFDERFQARPASRGQVRACIGTISRTFSSAKGSSRELHLERFRARPASRAQVRACRANNSQMLSGARGFSREFRACSPLSSQTCSGATSSSRMSSCLHCNNFLGVFRCEGLFKVPFRLRGFTQGVVQGGRRDHRIYFVPGVTLRSALHRLHAGLVRSAVQGALHGFFLTLHEASV